MKAFKQAPHLSKPVTINVFVHGIVGITPHLTIPNIIRLMRDDIDHTHYQHSVHYLRKDSFFCKAQAMAAQGLYPIDVKKKEAGYGPGALANSMEFINKQYGIEQTTLHEYYTFGWSGIATTSARFAAGKQLYQALKKLTQAYEQAGISYILRVYGYSHGGNVVLAAAAAAPCAPPFTIDEVIFLGMPVQCETDYLVAHALFKKPYHLYSATDFVPLMDCFSLKRFFSGKIFQSRKDFTIPKKLIQLQIRVTGPVQGKCSYRQVNTSRASFITGNSWFLRNRSPNHSEWWFFGWTASGYRDKFPLRPFCVASFIPYILAITEKSGLAEKSGRPLVVDLRPYYAQALVRPLYQIDTVMRCPFCSLDELAEWQDCLRPFVSSAMTVKNYNNHVEAALAKAKQRLMEEKQKKTVHQQGQGWRLLFWG